MVRITINTRHTRPVSGNGMLRCNRICEPVV